MGKLVPQDPNDSSAEVLLKQLSTSRNEKLKQQQSDNKEAETMLRKLNKLKRQNHHSDYRIIGRQFILLNFANT